MKKVDLERNFIKSFCGVSAIGVPETCRHSDAGNSWQVMLPHLEVSVVVGLLSAYVIEIDLSARNRRDSTAGSCAGDRVIKNYWWPRSRQL